MKTSALIAFPLCHKPWQGRPLRLILQDIVGPARQPEHDHRTHLRAAIDWLCRAQDPRKNETYPGCAAASGQVEDSGLAVYPQSTSYVIETFIAAAQYLGRPELIDRARMMIDADLTLQAADGAFPGPVDGAGCHPVIFNQGQIMHGLLAGYLSLDRQDCLEAALRAGHWLVAQQDGDGCFRKLEHQGVPHAYNARALWALAALGVIAHESSFVRAARHNLDWALSQQTPSGWFASNALMPGKHPFTYTIAHTLRGFIEVAVLLGEEHYLAAGEHAARALMAQQRPDGGLAGTYDDGWTPTARHVCLTGLTQMALCWLRLAQINGDQRYREAAWRAIAYVKRTQRIADNDPGIRGAIPGSTLIWGADSRFALPHWAAKFFADALMMDMTNVAIPPVPAMAIWLTR